MFCPKCGTPYSENDRFCTNCATRLDEVMSAEPSPAPAPKLAPAPKPAPVTAPAPEPEPAEEPKKKYKSIADFTFAEVKRLASSPSMIVMTIMFTLGLIYTISSSSVYSILASLEDMGLSRMLYELDLYSLLNYSASVISGIEFIFNLPSILFCISMWIVLSSALDKSNKRIITGALTLVKAVVIVSFIVTLLAFTALIIFMFSALNTFYGMQAFTVCMIPIGALVITIMYNVCLLSTLGSIRDAAVAGIPSTQISGFLIFCCYFSGITTIVFSLLDLTSLPGGIAVLACGVLLGNYKSAMQNIARRGKSYLAD